MPPGSVVDVVGLLIVFMFDGVTVSAGGGAAMAEPQADPIRARRARPLRRGQRA